MAAQVLGAAAGCCLAGPHRTVKLDKKTGCVTLQMRTNAARETLKTKAAEAQNSVAKPF